MPIFTVRSVHESMFFVEPPYFTRFPNIFVNQHVCRTNECHFFPRICKLTQSCLAVLLTLRFKAEACMHLRLARRYAGGGGGPKSPVYGLTGTGEPKFAQCTSRGSARHGSAHSRIPCLFLYQIQT